VAQSLLFTLSIEGTVLLGCPRYVTNQMNLRVPHPSRFLRSLGSYALTSKPFLSCLSLLPEPPRFLRLCVIFLFHFRFLPHSVLCVLVSVNSVLPSLFLSSLNSFLPLSPQFLLHYYPTAHVSKGERESPP
jgi:hypothetical protein